MLFVLFRLALFLSYFVIKKMKQGRDKAQAHLTLDFDDALKKTKKDTFPKNINESWKNWITNKHLRPPPTNFRFRHHFVSVLTNTKKENELCSEAIDVEDVVENNRKSGQKTGDEMGVGGWERVGGEFGATAQSDGSFFPRFLEYLPDLDIHLHAEDSREHLLVSSRIYSRTSTVAHWRCCTYLGKRVRRRKTKIQEMV